MHGRLLAEAPLKKPVSATGAGAPGRSRTCDPQLRRVLGCGLHSPSMSWLTRVNLLLNRTRQFWCALCGHVRWVRFSATADISSYMPSPAGLHVLSSPARSAPCPARRRRGRSDCIVPFGAPCRLGRSPSATESGRLSTNAERTASSRTSAVSLPL